MASRTVSIKLKLRASLRFNCYYQLDTKLISRPIIKVSSYFRFLWYSNPMTIVNTLKTFLSESVLNFVS